MGGSGEFDDRFDDRGRGGLGLELVEVLKGLAGGAAGALDAPLELAEGFGLAAGGGLAEGIVGCREGPASL